MTDFLDAASRHFQDGDHLLSIERLENADQLFGFAAECALKTAVLARTEASGDKLPSGYYLHIDELWSKMPSQALRKRYPTLYLLLKQPNPFGNWSVDQRYAASGTTSREVVEAHRRMTQRIFGALQIHGSRPRH